MPSLIGSITDVFSEIATWMTSAIADMEPIFWNSSSGLTFMGILACAGLGFSVILLVLSLIQKFMKFGA